MLTLFLGRFKKWREIIWPLGKMDRNIKVALHNILSYKMLVNISYI